jgi:thymidylate synthase (FAD)
MISMKVNLEYITPNAEETIGRYAAICYDANVESSACIRRAAKCARDGHLATLRFAHATFRVTGISRVCSHQFVRSKHLDFLQQSQRYVNSQAHSFVYPENAHAHIYASSYMHSMNLYNKLIDQGVKKEDARFVLPAGIATELVVVGNLQAWRDFIHLRLDKAAQWEIRQVALEVNNHLAHACPNLFNEREI